MSGVFGGSTKGVEQTDILKEFNKAFKCDLMRFYDGGEKGDAKELHTATILEVQAFVRGNHIGEGGKGDCFSYSQIANYREFDQMVSDWKEITKRLRNCFPPVTLIHACEHGDKANMGVVLNGNLMKSSNFWGSYGLLDRVV
jgi:hypothetical protein